MGPLAVKRQDERMDRTQDPPGALGAGASGGDDALPRLAPATARARARPPRSLQCARRRRTESTCNEPCVVIV